jgi:DNA-binding NtrC family response regulator
METQTTLPVGAQAGGKQEKVVLDVTALPTMEEVERQYLNLVLAQTGGNKVKTAKILGFSVKTIYNKLDGYKENESEIVRDSEKGS